MNFAGRWIFWNKDGQDDLNNSINCHPTPSHIYKIILFNI